MLKEKTTFALQKGSMHFLIVFVQKLNLFF